MKKEQGYPCSFFRSYLYLFWFLFFVICFFLFLIYAVHKHLQEQIPAISSFHYH